MARELDIRYNKGIFYAPSPVSVTLKTERAIYLYILKLFFYINTILLIVLLNTQEAQRQFAKSIHIFSLCHFVGEPKCYCS